MAASRFGWCVCLIVAPLYAGTIDVSSQSSVTLENGNTLTYAISAWSYKVHAAALGGPADPAYLSFSLLTDPLLDGLDLGFSLESYDGDVSVAVNDTVVLPGYLEGALYQGPITMDSGSMTLTPELSSQLFAGPAVLLVVRDLGGDVTLGIPPYELLQSLEVSLSGDAFSVGGTVAAVTFDPPGDPDPADTPEPQSGVLLALGGASLFLLARVSKRSRRLKAETAPPLA